MEQKAEYKSAGIIGLSSYILTWLICYGCSKIPIRYKWMWEGEDMFKWFCVFLFMLMNIIVIAAFVQLFSARNWNKGNELIIADWLFFIVTVVYILFWLLIFLLSLDNSHYVF